jgi:hypothetical protein
MERRDAGSRDGGGLPLPSAAPEYGDFERLATERPRRLRAAPPTPSDSSPNRGGLLPAYRDDRALPAATTSSGLIPSTATSERRPAPLLATEPLPTAAASVRSSSLREEEEDKGKN